MSWPFLKSKARKPLKQSGTSLAALRADASEILAGLRAVVLPEATAREAQRAIQAMEACIQAIDAIKARTEAGLSALSARRIAAGDHFRLLQLTHHTIRKPVRPDILKTLLIIVSFWLMEALMAGGVLISGGKVDVAPGLAYGLIFAGVNIIVGVLTGFLGLRYLSYREPYDVFAASESAAPIRRAGLIRGAAKLGTLAGVAAEAVLIFAAARLRALGSHEGVFEFSEIGALATYDDSLSLIITAIGTCSAILAIREGYVGLADPIPGYGEAYEQATGTIAAAGEEMADTAIDAIEEAAEDALEDAEDALDELLEAPREAEEQFLEIAGRIDAHNNAVTGAREEARKAGARKASDFGFVQGCSAPKANGFDAAAYEALLMPRIDHLIKTCRAHGREDGEPVRAAIARLQAARSEAVSGVNAALAAFEASSPNLDLLLDEEGDSDGTQ